MELELLRRPDEADEADALSLVLNLLAAAQDNPLRDVPDAVGTQGLHRLAALDNLIGRGVELVEAGGVAAADDVAVHVGDGHPVRQGLLECADKGLYDLMCQQHSRAPPSLNAPMFFPRSAA